MVVTTHFDRGQVTLGGVIGVKVFFTLSGFLITSLLLEEHTSSGRVDLSGFYRRRARRLLPGLAAVVTFVSLLTFAGWPTGVTTGRVTAIANYANNWYLLATAHDGVIAWNTLSHTWSLAIEEQFYFVWPLLVLAAMRAGQMWVLRLALAGATASLVWSIASGRPAQASDVSAWCLLLGCALAAWMHSRPARDLPPWPTAVAMCALIPLAFIPYSTSADMAVHIVAPLLTALTIWVAVQSQARWLQGRWITWVGRRSYGLYLWHAPVAYFCQLMPGPWPLVSASGILLSLGLTVLSWRFIEEPFLRRPGRSPKGDQGNVSVAPGAAVTG